MTQGPAEHPAETEPDTTPESGAAIEAARAQVDLILRARNINTVIYVDDGNPGQGQPAGDPEIVIAALQAGQLTIEILAASETTAHVAHTDGGDLTTADSLTSRLQLHIDEFTGEDLAALTDAVRLQSTTESETNATHVPEDRAVTESTATDLAALAELRLLIPDHDTNYQPITLADWIAQKARVLASTDPVLVLFDRDFSREGQSQDAGEGLLIEAIKDGNENVYCGMLTHRAVSDHAEHEMVMKIAERGGRDLVEIVVIAKQTVIDQPEAFPAKLKAALLARPLHALRNQLTTEYLRAAKAAVDDVNALDAYTLSELVAAADHEGSHGARNIARIAATKQRISVQRMLWTNQSFSELLTEIRTIHDAAAPRNPLPPTDVTRLRREDRYSDGEFLAELHLPLEPGDIFEKIDPAVLLRGATQQDPGKRYILLMQACDIAVRKTGRRLGEPLTLTLARLKPVDVAKVHSFDHRLEWYDEVEDGQVWCVQVWERVQIPVRALEACVYNGAGGAVVTTGQEPPVGLTPGWAKRFSDMQRWATMQLAKYEELVNDQTNADVKKIFTQHLSGTSPQVVEIKAELDPTDGRIAFGLRRIGRASDDDARLILANAGNYTARPDRDGNLFLNDPVELA